MLLYYYFRARRVKNGLDNYGCLLSKRKLLRRLDVDFDKFREEMFIKVKKYYK